MCGIFAMNSLNGSTVERSLFGISKILYRGYDSIGIAFDCGDEIKTFKKAHCEIEDLESIIDIEDSRKVSRSIGHNRWATVGEVNKRNAHPHWDYKGEFFIVQNGNVDNHDALQFGLKEYYNLKEEIKFRSDTDTELIANLISLEYCGNIEETLTRVMSRISGANVIVVMSMKHPDMIYGVKRGGSLLVHKGDDCVMLASDSNAFQDEHNRGKLDCAILDDGEIVAISNNAYTIKKEGTIVDKKTMELADMDDDAGLGDYDYFMEKEIFEQAQVLRNSIGGRLIHDLGTSKLGGIEEYAEQIAKVKTFHFIGCGTAYNACYYAKTLFNRFGVAANAWIASEFSDSHPVYDADDAFVFISQSGETTDTIEVLDEIKDIKQKLCLGIVNKQATDIPRKTHAGIHVRAGFEEGVASTKAYTAQLSCIALLAVFVARQRNMTMDTGKRILKELQLLPEKIDSVLSRSDIFQKLAIKYSRYSNCYFLGRYFNYITAMEGALKLKEVSYIHAEGYALGEMKHGPLALVDENFASYVIIPNDSVFEKSLTNISEIKARRGKVLAITTDDIDDIKGADDIIHIPKTLEYLQNIISTIPTQLIAYYAARHLETNPDKPRNLAKSVTTR